MAKTIVGLYDSFEDAREVREALVNAGFDRDDISILAANSENRYKDFVDDNIEEADYGKYYATDSDDDNSSAAEGAVAGGLIGGVGAAILAVFIPGIGPFTATGWLLAGLVGLAGGAITGGILGALVDSGIDEDDATVYSEGVRRGYALVTVRASDENASQVANIMNEHGAIDTDERAAYWESTGWNREYDADAPVYNLQEIEQERTNYNSYVADIEEGGTATVPVIKEELRVGKRRVATNDGLRVRTYMESEPVEETVSLTKESVHVDRKSVDREVGSADLDAFEEGVVEVTAMAEEAVTDKVARVVEEVTIRKDVDQVQKTVTDTVRRTGVDVDHTANINGNQNQYDDTAYRTHYETTYGGNGHTYDYYAPHYLYGQGLMTRSAYRNSDGDWNRLEPNIRRDWESRYHNTDTTWEEVKDAVRSGWQSVKQKV